MQKAAVTVIAVLCIVSASVVYIRVTRGALPTLNVTSPVNGSTYNTNLIWLNYTVSDATSVTYTLHPCLVPNAENISLNATSDNTKIPVHMNMSNTLTVYATNADGTVSQTIQFNVTKDELVFWITTDPHIGRDAYPGVNEEASADAINDSVSLYDWDYHICIGDQTENENQQDFDDMDSYNDIWYRNYSMKLQKGFSFQLLGNHEFNTTGDVSYANEYIDRIHTFWINNSAEYNTESLRYTVQIHNILLVFVPENYSNDPDVDRSYYDDCQQWFDDVVSNNQDKIIIVFSHFPVYGTTIGSQSSYDANKYILPIDCFNDTLANYTVDLWFHGHLHGSDTSSSWGVNISGSNKPTFTVNCGALRNDGSWGPAESWFLILHNNSNVATLRYYDNTNNEWGGTYCPSYYNITLSYNVNLSFSTTGNGSSENYTPEFVSIAGDTSSPVEISNGTPVFNWTKISSATKYWLQIDNNSDFSSPEVNLTNVNETSYPSEYTEKGGYVEFLLPSAYELGFGTYYTRVRAWYQS